MISCDRCPLRLERISFYAVHHSLVLRRRVGRLRASPDAFWSALTCLSAGGKRANNQGEGCYNCEDELPGAREREDTSTKGRPALCGLAPISTVRFLLGVPHRSPNQISAAAASGHGFRSLWGPPCLIAVEPVKYLEMPKCPKGTVG